MENKLYGEYHSQLALYLPCTFLLSSHETSSLQKQPGYYYSLSHYDEIFLNLLVHKIKAYHLMLFYSSLSVTFLKIW